VIDNGTIYIIKDGQKCPFRDWNEFLTYGFDLSSVKPATAEEMALGSCGIVRAKLGSLVLDPIALTVYLVGANDTKQPFTSSEAFVGLGFNFKNIIVLNLSDYPQGNAITTSQAMHPEGSLINSGGTIYLVLAGEKRPFPTEAVFKSYGFSFGQVVPANVLDNYMPIGGVME
jgi:hypothetical protein